MTTFDLTNQFLIAMPTMVDPNFSRSVTYVCAHNDDGAMGIVKDTFHLVERDVCKLSDSGKERVLATMLATLISDKNVSPVLSVNDP